MSLCNPTTLAAHIPGVMRTRRRRLTTGVFDRLQPFLRSKSWPSRTAAAQAVDYIVSHVPPWDPAASAAAATSETKEEEPYQEEEEAGDMLTLEEFDIDCVVEHGVALLGSSGDQYDLDLSSMSQKVPAPHIHSTF
jgi:TATA-binding protein-associated factor